jgi:hypothetical protein
MHRGEQSFERLTPLRLGQMRGAAPDGIAPKDYLAHSEPDT